MEGQTVNTKQLPTEPVANNTITQICLNTSNLALANSVLVAVFSEIALTLSSQWSYFLAPHWTGISDKMLLKQVLLEAYNV